MHLCEECANDMLKDEKEMDLKLEQPGVRFVDLRGKGETTATIATKPRDKNKTPWDDLMDRFKWIKGVLSDLEKANDAILKAIRDYIGKHNEWTRRVDNRLVKLEQRLDELENQEEENGKDS
jgi:hypothetical protein